MLFPVCNQHLRFFSFFKAWQCLRRVSYHICDDESPSTSETVMLTRSTIAYVYKKKDKSLCGSRGSNMSSVSIEFALWVILAAGF